MHMEKITPPPCDPAVARLMTVVGQFERNQIEAAVEGLIALLDARDDDCDLEPEEDKGLEEDGEPGSWPESGAFSAAAIGDDEREPEDWSQVRRHRERIRRTRCQRIDHGGRMAQWSTWQLRSEAAQAVRAVKPW